VEQVEVEAYKRVHSVERGISQKAPEMCVWFGVVEILFEFVVVTRKAGLG
jgi:hypothetical protein